LKLNLNNLSQLKEINELDLNGLKDEGFNLTGFSLIDYSNKKTTESLTKIFQLKSIYKIPV
jgi:hypothetical protein